MSAVASPLWALIWVIVAIVIIVILLKVLFGVLFIAPTEVTTHNLAYQQLISAVRW